MTPAAAPDIWLLALDQSPDRVRSLQELLSADELTRADAFATAPLRSRWIVARGGLRFLLGHQLNLPPAKVKLTKTKLGKPVLTGNPDDLHFNLAHCESHAAYVFSRKFPVGIDLENFSRSTELLTCMDAFCHPLERQALTSPPAPDALMRLWCAKEAALKAAGTGFQVEPSDVLVTGWDSKSLTATWPGSQVENWPITFAESPSSLCLAIAAPCNFAISLVQILTLDRL